MYSQLEAFLARVREHNIKIETEDGYQIIDTREVAKEIEEHKEQMWDMIDDEEEVREKVPPQ